MGLGTRAVPLIPDPKPLAPVFRYFFLSPICVRRAGAAVAVVAGVELPDVELTVETDVPIVTLLIVAPRSSSDVLITSGYEGCALLV